MVLTQEGIDAVADIGDQRLEAAKSTGAPTYEPPLPLEGRDVGETLTRQIAAAGGADKLLIYYYELLQRSTRLVNFVDHNFGIGGHWPVDFEGDSIAPEHRFDDLVTSARNATKFITELTP